MRKRRGTSRCGCVGCVQEMADREWGPLIERAQRTVDALYELAIYDKAERLDALLEEFLESVHAAMEELSVESHHDLETGIEDYETGDGDDEAPGPQYWEPDMIVASDSGF